MRLIEWFLKNRDAFALALLICGAPLNYFLRDGLGLAPNSTVFSFAFTFGAIFIVLPFRNFKTLFHNNSPLTLLGIVYLLFSLVYILIYTDAYLPTSVTIYDSIVIALTFYLYFYFGTIREDKVRLNFLEYSLALSFLGCLGLLYYMLSNPNYVLGMRAGIAFGEDEMGSQGNPHIFGRGAFFGLVCVLVYIKYEPRALRKYISYLMGLLFFVVLVLSQAMSSILAAFLMFSMYFYHNTSRRGLWKGIKTWFSKWYFWVIVLGIIFKGIDLFRKNSDLFYLGFLVISNRFEKLLNTFLPSDTDSLFGEEVTVDQSAMGRVETIGQVQEIFIENFEDGNFLKIIFGNGYRALYVDVPVLEVFHSFGLVGLGLFGTLFILLIQFMWKEMRKPKSLMGEFAAYGFVYFIVFNFTNGLILDYTRWTFIVLASRFLALKINSPKNTL